ncbi:hypothetical protein GTY49_05075, partial [Streptomyces sp. SID5477]|nr:hypothetical protein [Streptomyces sp. SID5477]
MFGLDRQGGDPVQLVLQRTAPDHAGGEGEGVLEALVPQDQAAVAVEQDEG